MSCSASTLFCASLALGAVALSACGRGFDEPLVEGPAPAPPGDAAPPAEDDAAAPDSAPSPPADAAPPPDALPPPDPMAACTVDRDVFHIDVGGVPGGCSAGPITLTNHDSQWSVFYQSLLEVSATAGGGFGVSLDAYASALPAAGTYALQPGQHGASLDVFVDGDGCCALTSGSFTIESITVGQSDAGYPVVSSLAMWFTTSCDSSSSLKSVSGCVRYEASP